MSILAQDDFNRDDGALGANWTSIVIGGGVVPVIAGGMVTSDTDGWETAAIWTADTCPDDQYSQLTAINGVTLNTQGVIVRGSGSAGSRTFYSARIVGTAGIELSKCVAGSTTNFGQFGSGGVDGDVVRIAAIGTTIQCFLDAVQQGADHGDSAIASGAFGLRTSISAGVGAVDNWSGGSAEPVPPLWLALGPQSGHVFAEETSVGTISIVSPGNAADSDDTYVTFTVDNGETSHYLKVTDFQFAVPLTADISGITVEIEKAATVASAIQDYNVRLVKGGVISGDNNPDNIAWPTTDAYVSYGDVDQLWGQSWTPADINAADFGVVVAGMWLDDATGRIDHVRITVYYVPAGVPQGITQQFQAGSGMSITERHSLIRQH